MKFERTREFIHEAVDLGYETLGDASTEGKRVYVTPEGNQYPSITTILGIRDKGYLEDWKKAVGEEEAARVCRHAAHRGTALHDLLEDYLNNEDIDLSKIMPHVQLMFKSARSVLDSRVGKILLQERPLYSDVLRVAGRVDVIGEFDGELSVIDFKTSKRIKKEEDISDYFIQTAAYAAMFYERTGIPIKKTAIVMTVDGSPKPLIFVQNPYSWLPELLKTVKLWENSHIL